MNVFMFPGQGSQVRGMGGGLFDEVREFTSVERDIDRLLGYSLRALCLEDSADNLKDTRYTQPALFITNALHYYKAIAQGERPQYLVGHSLGEYDALLAAGAIDLIGGVRIVQRRGELMWRARNGGMAALVGITAQRVAAVMRESALYDLDIANYNSPFQTVISGPLDTIQRVGPIFEKAGAQMYLPLPVSGAFHSRYMADSGEAFADFLYGIDFQPLRLPVIANVTGEPYPMDGKAETIRSLLISQISQPVRWTQSIRTLLARGATSFKEMGPGTVLTRLVQQIQRAPEG
jgi:malonyl CoA-acyl carrier protein transacylase